MPDFRVSDTAAFDDKMIQAGNSAIGLWARAGAWCMQQLTDGFVPTRIARQIGTKAQADRLTDCGLWESVDGGYRFVKFLNHQRSKEQVESEKAAARQRMRKVRSGERSSERTEPVQPNGSGERSPHVHDSHPFPSLPSSGYEGREGYVPERASDDPPTPRCPKHIDVENPPACGACADARRTRETWDTEQAQRRAESERAERLAAAEAARAAIDDCGICDENGYRGTRLCDHDPETAARAARGMALVREQLAASASKGSSS
ncbi:hypothetical protein SEA_FENRY_70 [Gordonia phage Fenry]|nr:hypothetical protein SEA_FENRY_70 [Gordonia phage Fenry]QDK02285.1 hypothetical protein SEA_SAMBA_71 [Gordonia phage Samba]